MNSVELIREIENLPEGVEGIVDFALATLDRIGVKNWQMGIVITDDSGICEYNREWRNTDKATDVLSFAHNEGVPVPHRRNTRLEAGDIVISLESIARNARNLGTPFDLEFRRVVIHGILHLKGMDHSSDDYEMGMLQLQEELLSETGRVLKGGL